MQHYTIGEGSMTKFAHSPEAIPRSGQRICSWDEDSGHWLIDDMSTLDNDVVGEVCRMDHPLSGVQRETFDRDRERGGLGMPTIGGGIGTMLDPYDTDDKGPGENVRQIHGGDITKPVDMRVTLTADGMEVAFDDGKGYAVPAVTDDARYIMSILPDLLKTFLIKNAQYRDAQQHDLGIKGIIPDINRKSSAIITRVWHANNERDGEIQDSTQELAGDLIGHLLLMLAKMR
jgi:hypothetical protein